MKSIKNNDKILIKSYNSIFDIIKIIKNYNLVYIRSPFDFVKLFFFKFFFNFRFKIFYSFRALLFEESYYRNKKNGENFF